MNKNIVTTEKLCKTFSNGGFQQHVLKNLDFQLYTGGFELE